MIVAAKAILTLLGAMAVHGTLLALIAIALVRGGRMRPAWRAAVWLVVLAKFALPWGPALPWSLADVLAMLRGGGGDAGPIVVGAPVGHAVAAGPSPAWVLLAFAWAAGAAVVLLCAVLANGRARRAARQATPAPVHALALLGELAARLGVRAPRLVVGEGAYVVGLWRPTIVVPAALVTGEPALLRAALVHELAHVRRRDALGRCVQLAAAALYWWYPVVRLASRRLELAREAACDAWALEAGDISRPAYARLLVQMTHASPALALAAPRALDDRVRAVLGPVVAARLGRLHGLALLVWALIALGGARSAAARGEHVTCVYTPQLAENLLLAHPEADLDGDGVLTHAEACDFQAELRHRMSEAEPVSNLDQAESELLAEPLCCNRDAAEGLSSPAACPFEGVDR